MRMIKSLGANERPSVSRQPELVVPTPRAIIRIMAALIRATRSVRSHVFIGGLLIPLLSEPSFLAHAATTNTPAKLFASALKNVVAIAEPPASAEARTFTATIKLVKSAGMPKELTFRKAELAFQSPDHLRLAVEGDRGSVVMGRNGQELWVHLPAKKFGLIGSPDTPLFSTSSAKDETPLGPLKLGLPAEQLAILPLMMDFKTLPDASVGGTPCNVLTATIKPEAVETLKLPAGTFQLWLRESDAMPLRIAYRQPPSMDLTFEIVNPQFSRAQIPGEWKLKPNDGDRIESVARAHLTRFVSASIEMFGEKIPTLGPATGERRVVAREGEGRLEIVDGTKVLYLKGTPEEMGREHGKLLKKEIHGLVDRILYGVGVGSSFEDGKWVFGEIEAAQKRLNAFMDPCYYREMDALADASGLRREEVRLANFFPEMFHCSGFALYGKATIGGRLYHGRILDYLRGLGLEQNAVVMVMQPANGNAWVNISYAGFIGSVTAMNEKQIAIGEMGGKGQGNWDGKPMAELVREVMEKAGTLDDAVEIMRKGPRTCEYYYVISDAKSKRAVGIAATADKFTVILPGQSFDQLPHPFPDAVVMSAGDRYDELVRRVEALYGKFDAASARDLMKRPVCMTSNIHCALFAPDTLDFWVANADSKNVAAATRYTHYNLAEMLKPEALQ